MLRVRGAATCGVRLDIVLDEGVLPQNGVGLEEWWWPLLTFREGALRAPKQSQSPIRGSGEAFQSRENAKAHDARCRRGGFILCRTQIVKQRTIKRDVEANMGGEPSETAVKSEKRCSTRAAIWSTVEQQSTRRETTQ